MENDDDSTAATTSVARPAPLDLSDSSPDLLKNTPSNIARLEDAIEQCQARDKYRAHTKSPSDGDDVRWFFCKVPLAPLELAASIPHTEIVGKSEYFRFSMRDSLALEASFLQREEELLSHWWKEYAECSEGPRGSNVTSKVTSVLQLQTGPEGDSRNGLYIADEERVGVPVKGGLYEVDLVKRHCFPVYWDGENRRVLRGHWYARKGDLDWLPLREDIGEQLEFAYNCQIWHRRKFQPSGLFAARVDLQGSTKGLHALFTGQDDTWEAWLNTDNAGFSLTSRGNGLKLRRGFSSSGSLKPTQDEQRQQKEEEMDDYCSQVPVGHLVFMVHGIGQRLEKANLVDDVGNFRQITASLSERHLTPYQRSTQRVLYIPCQWRRRLKLSGESAVEKITLPGVRDLRVALSATVHDVLYYMSPIYCQAVIDSVSSQLNRLYQKFLKRNPGYSGKVSIYGHSLGSVLSYDILCHQETLSSPFPMGLMYFEATKKKEIHKGGGDQRAISISDLSDDNGCPDDADGNQEGSKCTIDEKLLNVQSSYVGFHNHSSHSDECSKRNSEKPDELPVEDEASEVSNDMPADLADKDKLIASLNEEVSLLKAKLVKLEKSCSLRGSACPLVVCDQDGFHGNRKFEITRNSLSPRSYPVEQDNAKKIHKPNIKYTKLDFKVDTFFAVGSPLGVFLSLRNIRIGVGRGQEYWQDEGISEEMPCCRQMLNIFHPYDPVAYRIEPLVCKEYISKRPVIIPYHRGGKRVHIGLQEFTEDVVAQSHVLASHFNMMKVKMVRLFHPSHGEHDEEVEEECQVKEKSYGSIMMERLTGSEDGRIDHMIQDKTFEHPYISALGSHTNYWRDHDTALFILKHLYKDIPEECDTAGAPEIERKTEDNRRDVERFFQNEALDETLPLTFYDKFMIREFSRRARKASKSS